MKRLHLPALLLATTAGAQTRQRDVDPRIDRLFRLARAEYSGDRAKETVASMSGKQRWPGNTAFDASLDRVIEQLRAAGYVHEGSAPPSATLTYRVEQRPLRGQAWDMIEASLTVIGDAAPLLHSSTNFNLLAVNSASTPDTGVVAEVVDVGRGTPADYDRADVAGKVVLIEGSAGRAYVEAVHRRNAIGVLGFTLPAFNRPEVNRNIIGFTSVSDTGRRAWAMPISRAAFDSLRTLLRKGPVRVRAIAKARSFPSVERTVVAEVKGTTRPAERFVFSAHAQEPGANDNASGVGAQTEMARVLAVLSKNGSARPKRTITMIFGNEIAQTRNFLAADSARTRDVKWGISLDMVGEDTEKTGGTFLIEKMPDPSAVWTRGQDKHSEWGGSPLGKDRIVPHYFNDFLLDRALDQAATTGWVVNTNPFEGGSDHTPFLTAKKPGVLFWHFTDQFYHTDGDRIEMVSPKTLANVGITALVSALTLTTADGALTRRLVEEVERAAIRRLDTELALSQKAIADGGKKAAEVEILETWTDYYAGAIEAMREIEVGGSSAETIRAIERAKARVRSAGAARIARLES
ncbi:MAG TPA: M28 family peptidase [Gemmatimonadaceae bacterium]|nr:M28 family peptidase [Gemmatimonadaceae bacterium]